MANSRLRRHWADIGEAGASAGMWFLYWSHRVLGRTGFRVFLFPVIGYFFLTRREQRQASLDYLRRMQQCHGVFAAPGVTWRLSLRHFIAFAETAIDKALALAGRVKPSQVDTRGAQILAPRIDNGEGGLLVVSHLGNLELCRAWGETQPKLRLIVLVHTRHAEKFNRMLERLNPDSRMELWQVTELSPATAIKLTERVRQGYFVVIAGDRVPVAPKPRTVTAPFLGAPAPFPVGPWVLANLLQCPVYLTFCLRREHRYEVIIEAFRSRISVGRGQRDAEFKRLSEDFAARLEHHCRSAPLQWFNFYDFWNDHYHA